MSEEKPVPAEGTRKTVLTCAQPTGILHLGNYLGAVKNWGEVLNQGHECYFGVVDLHAITMPYSPADLRHNSINCVAQYIACGLDPDKAAIFMQSHVIGHTELAWVLSCITPLGQLERMTQFKDKAAKLDQVRAGLLTYPVLMAADILIYNADLVPVGEDQIQHLELARDLARIFNNTYSPTFTLPEPVLGKAGARIMALQDPGRKMSKSDPNQGSVLYILDKPEVVRRKIGRSVTDTGSEIADKPGKDGISNLLHIMSAATGRPIVSIEDEFAGKGYGEFKSAVADAVIAMLEPVQKRYDEVIHDKGYLEDVLRKGHEKAQAKACKMLSKVYRKCGFVERPR